MLINTLRKCQRQNRGAAVAEWLSSWLAEQEDRGSIPGLATWIFRDWLSPASKSRYGWKIAKSTLILKNNNSNKDKIRQEKGMITKLETKNIAWPKKHKVQNNPHNTRQNIQNKSLKRWTGVNDENKQLIKDGNDFQLSVNLKNATPLAQTKCEKWTLITIHFE